MRLATATDMATGLTGRERHQAPPTAARDQRRAPRIDVLMRVKGHLVAIDAPIVVHNLSQTGFAIVSQFAFDAGDTFDFRLTADGRPPIQVTARAVHSQPMPAAPGQYLGGFMFVPGRLTGLVPQSSIDQLIDAISPHVPCF